MELSMMKMKENQLKMRIMRMMKMKKTKMNWMLMTYDEYILMNIKLIKLLNFKN